MNVYYAETDHLGSLLGLMNSDGSYAERYSFDPWGQRRNPSNWSYDSIPVPALTDRGFTGHEHLDEFGLINMNGRLYDTLTARFLNADPIIQDPFDSQNLNLYSYCLNNPLKYTDPSGYYTHPWNAWREAVRNGYPGTYSEFSDIYDQMCSDAGGDSFTFSWNVNSYAIIGETYVGKDNVVHTPELVFTCRVLKIVYYDDPQYSNTVDNSSQATNRYLFGDGSPATIGLSTINSLLSSPDFINAHEGIINNPAVTSGRFNVNLKKQVFHIGKTNVSFIADFNSRTVTYKLFEGDGFWDPDFIDEKILGEWGLPKFMPDGPGPNLERFRGMPYYYIPVIITLPF